MTEPLHQTLSNKELATLIHSVFNPGKTDRTLALLTDVPNQKRPDTDAWSDRRKIVYDWRDRLESIRDDLAIDTVALYLYENVESNNADLPEVCYRVSTPPEPLTAADLPAIGEAVRLESVLEHTDILLVPSQYSATAPLKMLGKKYPFRAATMPGFSRAMIPALGLDYGKVHERVMILKNRLDEAVGASISFGVDRKIYSLYLDLRYRKAHASSGLIRDRGTAGNLPSGETYIVPYEGENKDDPSRTTGTLPVQFGDTVLLFHIENNRALSLTGTGKAAREQSTFLHDEPAYGNIAEFGLGILESFGITAVGSVLLDEKLGLHIALGRSEHFGGITGPDAFTNPKNVVHQDFVYVPSLQPSVSIHSALLHYENRADEEIMRQNRYTV
jgi:hypothetical protein